MLTVTDLGCDRHIRRQVTLNGVEAEMITDVLYNLNSAGDSHTYICECGHTHRISSKLSNMRRAMVEVGITETYEEAWLRHLSTHPEDHHANVRIFKLQKSGAEPERPR